MHNPKKETNEKFIIGQKIELNFTLPNYSKPFKLTGTISWGSPRGFGVKFEEVPVRQGEILRSFVEQKEEVAKIKQVAKGYWWIDMESGIRDPFDWLDTRKVQQIKSHYFQQCMY